MFKQLILGTLFACFIIFLPGCQYESVEAGFTVGNSSGNIYNGGYIVEKNGWIYYTNFNDDSSIYKQRIDGGGLTKITSGHYGYELNLVGDYIYYISGAPGEVFRVDINGKKDKLLVNQKVENLIVTNKYIFYRLSLDNDWGKLYRTDLDGKNKKMLAKSTVDFAVADDWIYFSNGEDGNKLYKMDLEGENITKLVDQSVLYINFDNEFLYYTESANGNLYRIRKDGSENTLLSAEECRSVNVHNGYIYYCNQSQGGKIFRMRSDDSDHEMIVNQKNCGNLNITDHGIIYRIPESTGGYFKANLDGSDVEKWSN